MHEWTGTFKGIAFVDLPSAAAQEARRARACAILHCHSALSFYTVIYTAIDCRWLSLAVVDCH